MHRPKHKYLISPPNLTGMPPGVPYIIGNEAAERFSYYGMKSVLTVFMAHYILNQSGVLAPMNENESYMYTHLFVFGVYFLPILGAILAVWLGLTAAGGIFATFKMFFIVGLIAMAVFVVVWLVGLFYLLFHRDAKRFRFLAYTYLIFLALMMYLKGKDYYLAPIYPMLYAAGARFWEKLIRACPRLRWARIAVPSIIIVVGIVAAPLVLPILPPDKVPGYMAALGLKMTRTENGMVSPLPQHFADQFGWPEMVAKVADVYNSLPPDQRAETAILAGDYGGAGAIDFFGRRYGLPKSISAHQNYYFWGPRDYTGESVILLEWSLKDAQYWCRSVDVGPRNEPFYGMGWEHYNILVCHDFRIPLSQAWPKLKTWN